MFYCSHWISHVYSIREKAHMLFYLSIVVCRYPECEKNKRHLSKKESMLTVVPGHHDYLLIQQRRCIFLLVLIL
jgi:hypothetical protein